MCSSDLHAEREHQNQVRQDERAAAVLRRQIRKTPHIAQADGRSRTGEDERPFAGPGRTDNLIARCHVFSSHAPPRTATFVPIDNSAHYSEIYLEENPVNGNSAIITPSTRNMCNEKYVQSLRKERRGYVWHLRVHRGIGA